MNKQIVLCIGLLASCGGAAKASESFLTKTLIREANESDDLDRKAELFFNVEGNRNKLTFGIWVPIGTEKLDHQFLPSGDYCLQELLNLISGNRTATLETSNNSGKIWTWGFKQSCINHIVAMQKLQGMCSQIKGKQLSLLAIGDEYASPEIDRHLLSIEIQYLFVPVMTRIQGGRKVEIPISPLCLRQLSSVPGMNADKKFLLKCIPHGGDKYCYFSLCIEDVTRIVQQLRNRALIGIGVSCAFAAAIWYWLKNNYSK